MWCTDLFFATKLRETARTAGVALTAVRDQDGLLAAIRAAVETQQASAGNDEPAPHPRRVLRVFVDLSGLSKTEAGQESVLGALRSLHALARAPEGEKRAIEVIGFVSHVQVELRRAALAAGCHRVLARSQLTHSLPDLLVSSPVE
jgi:hypothetical protein